MNYLPRNNSKILRKRELAIVFAVFAFGAMLFYFLGGPVVSLVSPLWRAENTLTRSTGNVAGFFASRDNLSRENIELRSKISILETELELLRFESRREELFTQMFTREFNREFIPATVLTYPPQTPYDIVVVDAGSTSRVGVEALVFLPEGAVLGRVIEVSGKSAKVILFTSPGEETVGVLERGLVPVTLIGSGGGNFTLSISREIEVVLGDRILSPRIDSELLAVVGDIRFSPTDSFKEVSAYSPINIFNFRAVLIER